MTEKLAYVIAAATGYSADAIRRAIRSGDLQTVTPRPRGSRPPSPSSCVANCSAGSPPENNPADATTNDRASARQEEYPMSDLTRPWLDDPGAWATGDDEPDVPAVDLPDAPAKMASREAGETRLYVVQQARIEALEAARTALAEYRAGGLFGGGSSSGIAPADLIEVAQWIMDGSRSAL